MKKKDIIFYTAIFGDYDNLREPPKGLLEKCDFFCFTDNKNIHSENYQIIHCKKKFQKNQYLSRKYKILPHKFIPKEYKFSIWIDGSIELKDFDIDKFVKQYATSKKWVSFIHPDRDCIYEEGEACIQLKKDSEKIIKKQLSRYKKDSYPKNNGLAANGFILRKNDDKEVNNICKLWWKEFKKGSKRDQLSFCYVAWKNNFDYEIIKEHLWNNKYFKVLDHKQK